VSECGASNKTTDAVALDHAWKWFEYHANQRMTMIRFYVVAVGGIAAATGVLLTVSHENFLAGLMSVLGIITSLAFKRLDKRVSDLVKIGEDALKHEQAKLGVALGSQKFEICHLAGEKPEGVCFYTYGENFRLLFTVLAIGFFIVLVISFSRLVLICGQ